MNGDVDGELLGGDRILPGAAGQKDPVGTLESTHGVLLKCVGVSGGGELQRATFRVS